LCVCVCVCACVHIQVVGEYAYLLEDMGVEEVIEKVTCLLGMKFKEAETCGWVVSALTKLVSQLGRLPESVQSHIALYLNSTSTDVQQVGTTTPYLICLELCTIWTNFLNIFF